jgi:arsenate reductase
MMDPKPGVLFVCTGNSCRSQMAEGFLRALGGDRFEAFSAGTDPHPIHPLTVQVMAEAGIDIRGQRPTSLSEHLGKRQFACVVAVCDRADRSCPSVLPGVGERLFWPFDDPAAFEGTDDERLARFRQVRDQIRARIQAWLDEMPPAQG